MLEIITTPMGLEYRRIIEPEYISNGWHRRYKYILIKSIPYYSPRYKKVKTLRLYMLSDGATGAPDIVSSCWWFHDAFCAGETWDDGTPLTEWQNSTVLYDIMRKEGFNIFRATRWRLSTFIFRTLFTD